MSDHFSHEIRKTAGTCSVSGECVWEHTATFPDWHHNAGAPRSLAEPMSNALRVTLILVSGAQAVITVHEDHIGEVENNLPAIWRSIKAATRHGRTNHRGNGQKTFTPEQNAFMDQQNMAQFDDVPLGVLCYEKWSDHSG